MKAPLALSSLLSTLLIIGTAGGQVGGSVGWPAGADPATQSMTATGRTTPYAAPYAVQRDDPSGRLTVGTRFYTIGHDLKHSGAIDVLRFTHGRAVNLLVAPIAMRIQD